MIKKELSEQAKVGLCRGPATPAAGAVDIGPITDDDLELGRDVAQNDGVVVGDQEPGVFRDVGVDVATQEARGG